MGRTVKEKGVVETYEIFVKDYRYVIRVKYIYQQNTEYEILGSDGLMSISKCTDSIEQHKEIGGFMNIFFFCAYENYSDLLDFEKTRTAEMIGFLKDEGANR